MLEDRIRIKLRYLYLYFVIEKRQNYIRNIKIICAKFYRLNLIS